MKRSTRDAIKTTRIKIQEKDRELLWLGVAIVAALLLLAFSAWLFLASIGVKIGNISPVFTGSIAGIPTQAAIGLAVVVLGCFLIVLRVVGVLPELSETVHRDRGAAKRAGGGATRSKRKRSTHRKQKRA